MLHKSPDIIAPETFSLIQELQSLPELKDFYLVGGTALALKLGHRNSIDIDLFTNFEFVPGDLAESLRDRGFDVIVTLLKKNALLSVISNVKSDFIRHNYDLINSPIVEEGITYLSLEDIAAMKIHAITNSGKRLKDFVDLYFLLEHFSLNEIVGYYSRKYPDFNSMIALKAVNYFDDLDLAIEPPRLVNPISLEDIKERLNDAVLHKNKIF